MSKLRYHIAVMAAKFSKVIIRLSGRNGDRKSTRLNSSHANESRMPSSA